MSSIAPVLEPYKTQRYPALGAVKTPRDVVAIAAPVVGNLDRECVLVGLLNVKLMLFSLEVVSIGSLTGTLTHPREIFKPAIVKSAYGIIVIHNHPSGDTTPSEEDVRITTRLIKAGEILGIPLIDHIIIGANEYCSLRSKYPDLGWADHDGICCTAEGPRAPSA